MFHPLTMNQVKEIVKIQLNKVMVMLGSNNIELEITEAAVNWLAERSYDPQLGARPVKRLIQKELINELSKELISGKISKEDKIIIDIKDDNIRFSGGKRDKYSI
jgi:ATP-dependent Clp protease ATP-binding subunit ClpB